MRRVSGLVAAVVGLLLSGQAVSQSPSPTRSVEALSALASCGQSTGTSLQIAFVANGRELPTSPSEAERAITIKARPQYGKLRLDTQWSSGTKTFLLANGRARMRQDGRDEKIAFPAARWHRIEYVPGILCSLDITRPEISIEYIGLEQVGNRTAHHIHFSAVVTDKDGQIKEIHRPLSDFHLFVDVQSFLPVKAQQFVFSPDGVQNRSVLTTLYSDYRQIGTVMMPFHQVSYVSRRKVRDLVFDSVDVNAVIADAEFE